MQLNRAKYLQALPEAVDHLCEAVEASLKTITVTEEQIFPTIKKIAQAIEGKKANIEYAKKVYSNHGQEFEPVKYSLREMQKYFEYYWVRQGKEFRLTKEYFKVYNNLCKYFVDDPSFDGDLNKGLWLYGCVGDGKTSIMKAFALNQKESFRVVSVADIAEAYKESGSGILKQYGMNTKRPRNPFGQTELALCLDDVGTESVYKNFGDPLNVVERIILKRYEAGLTTHFTTNLNTETIKGIYGDRAASRLRERVNIIELPSVDLRR